MFGQDLLGQMLVQLKVHKEQQAHLDHLAQLVQQDHLEQQEPQAQQVQQVQQDLHQHFQ
jgi:hypothetical protein